MIEFLAERADLPGTKSVYMQRKWGACVVFSDTLDLPQALQELARVATKAGNLHWVPPKELGGPIRALVYLDETAKDQVEWHAEGSDLHYRVRPGLDINTVLSAVMRAISDAANQGWNAAPAHRAAG